MGPNYSILYYREELEQQLSQIDVYLKNGIKVFWFGTPEEKNILIERYEPFVTEFFLQVFQVPEGEEAKSFGTVRIYDGQGVEESYAGLFHWMEEAIPAFNVAQYRVEHCPINENIMVKASAGTGKTTVMVDRIMYLLHMKPDLDMSEIYMVTFTNEATNQMNERLQTMMQKKYFLTKNKKYLMWLEQQEQMHISTIDSLAYDLFREYGVDAGFGRELRILTMDKERKDIFKDLLSDCLSEDMSIVKQIGMTYTEASRLLDQYWKDFTRKGYTVSEILEMDWGKLENMPMEEHLQNTFRNVWRKFDEKYRKLKLEKNATSVQDLFFDFGHYLLDGIISCHNLSVKFLFVDEFQDTDITQIRTFADLVEETGAKLFVVGDAKQSIYSFKGATDQGFDMIQRLLGNIKCFSLRNNYRTCGNLMKIMEQYFLAWSKEGLLSYDETVRPFNTNKGSVIMEFVEDRNSRDRQTIDLIDEALNELELEIRSGQKKQTDKSKVAVLVRGNARAAKLAQLCRQHGKTVVLNSDRPFFLSQAVRDFYAMISSYVFEEKPVYMYNYLMTPYASYEGTLSIQEMDMEKEDPEKIKHYLMDFVKQTQWYTYQREFRTRSILAVLKEMIADERVIQNYIAMDKARLTGTEWNEIKRNKQALIDAKIYQQNLEKLLEMLQQQSQSDFMTIYDLYEYLTFMIATNREEMEPDLETVNDYTSVYIMTVHKSKGLEYDTVIMPVMNGSIEPREQTSFLTDQGKVAWFYEKKRSIKMSSPYYDELWQEVREKGVREETRMLYVAMTRAVNKLVLLVDSYGTYESWSSLIRKVGIINE